MIVKPITLGKYEEYGLGQIVTTINILEKECSCKKFQLSHLPCTDIATIARSWNLSDYF